MCTPIIFRTGLLILLIALLMTPPHARGQEPTLGELRTDFAMRFLEPAPHMALAKYYLDRGNRLLAFDILEAARRTRFEEAIFNRAFQLSFRKFDYSDAAETILLKDLSTRPRSEDLLFKLADLYIAREDWPKAKQYLLAGIKLRPDEFKFTTGLAGVLRIERNTEGANRLINDYVRNYPASEEAYAIRAEKLMEAEPEKAEALLLEARERFPKAGDIMFDVGRVLQGQGKAAEAENSFVKAAELSPDSPDIQAWTGRFLYKVRDKRAQALGYYLNAYFLNPHAYETEFVESRINRIATELAEAEIENKLKTGTRLEEFLEDSNPAVVGLALERLSENWKAPYGEPVLKCMEHDDGGIRWQATEALKKNIDRRFDENLKALLQDRDLRKRGLSAYLAVHLWQKDSFPILKNMLTEKAQLVRFDAVSALMLEGGDEGRKIVFEYAAREPNPILKQLIERSNEKR